MINIIQASKLDKENRITAWIKEWVGYDPLSGAYMWASSGRRMTGRPRKYIAVYGKIVVRFTATTIEDAVVKANTRLNKETGE